VLKLILILVVQPRLQPVMPLLYDFHRREMLRTAFAALHQFVDRAPTRVAVLPPLQKDRAKSPPRGIEGGLSASGTGGVCAGPEPVEGTVKEMPTERQQRLVLGIHSLGAQIQELQGVFAGLGATILPGHADQSGEEAGLLN